jgi:lysophospholipase L1-like esterase
MFVGLFALAACSDSKPTDGGGGAGAGAAGAAGLGTAGSGKGGSTTTGGGGANAMSGASGKPADGGAGPTGGSGNEAGVPGSNEPGVHWLGRVQRTSVGARFAWPGTGFEARFRGTGLTVKLKTTADDDYFQVVVDGKVTRLTTHAGEDVYELANGLTEGEHMLTFWRRTETLAGVVEVQSIDVIDGALLSPPSRSGKLIEVVGDSITVGFGVDCRPEDGFSYATMNNYLTYQAVAGRALGADVVTLAWTGIGMLRDDDGQEGTQMPERYLRTIATEAASQWSFDGLTPDAVVIALGTNDFATGDPGADYVSAYAKFLDDTRARYPEARLYLAGSPMIDDGLVQYLTQLKNTRSARGDENVAVIDFQPPADDAGWGCGHPNAATHKIMAARLEKALKADLGW